MTENILIHSAGSFSVAVLALLMFILQALFFFREPQFKWHAWSAAVSFSALLYSVGIFIEYNTPQGPLNRFSGLLEYTAIICLIHAMYGFTFSCLGIESKRYHPIAGVFHGIIIIMLWFTDYIVSDTFVVRNFINMQSPYIEPGFGPFNPAFSLYAAIAAVYVMVLWLKHQKTDRKSRICFMGGIGFWVMLGIHDGMASQGMPAFQYLMEYGFLGFAMVVLWLGFNKYQEISTLEKYRLIIEFANDSILLIQDGKMIFGNPACYRLTGRPLSDSVPKDFLEIMAPEDRATVLADHTAVLEGGHAIKPHTVRIRRKDGKHRFVEIKSSVIEYRDRPAVLAIMRDVTERKQEEAARQENEKKIARLQKMESLGVLAGGVAHDLNNVLSGIVSYPELILLGLPDDSTLRKPIETIQKSGLRAVAIVQDLLTLARRGVKITKVVNLNTIISEYLQSPEFEKLLEFHQSVRVESRLDPDLLNISGSTVHLSKTIMNLVSNAAEAMTDGGKIIISSENRFVDRPIQGYDEVKEGDYVVLTVTDAGIGISPEEKERIFEPFYTKKVMGRSGTGLGMSVVWGTVKDHKGYIDIESTEGKGTAFTLYFPATKEALPAHPKSLSPDAYKGKGEKILVVDDMETQREIASMILFQLGYRVTAVSSGEEAVACMKSDKADLVILDMLMYPGMDGLDTYMQILKIHPGQKAVIASGFSETDRVRKAQDLGAGQYVKKPYTLEKIGWAVRSELDRRKAI